MGCQKSGVSTFRLTQSRWEGIGVFEWCISDTVEMMVCFAMHNQLKTCHVVKQDYWMSEWLREGDHW